MRVESIRALPEFAPVRPSVPADSRVAVLLNANAKHVNKRVERALRHVVPSSDLFVSHSIEEARSIARWVVDQRYRTVFSGGGDGTFVGWLNLILELIEEAPGPRKAGTLSMSQPRCPRFGILRLGTGNALAELVGASRLQGDGVLDDVLRARAGEVAQTRTLDLISVDGKVAPFAGSGLDGAVLNDYVQVKQTMGRGLGTGGLGYFLAVASRSVPQQLIRKPAEVEIVSNGRAQAIGPDGRGIGDPIAAGEVLYQGPARLVSGGTIPFYGFRFKLFPFAGKRRSMMHLRIADLSVPTILGNLGRIWNGKFTHPGVRDFYADDVSVTFDRDMPLQIGGDAAGYRKNVRLTMAHRSVEVIDFTSAAH
jgi:diacylglycerol kinase family enzyme